MGHALYEVCGNEMHMKPIFCLDHPQMDSLFSGTIHSGDFGPVDKAFQELINQDDNPHYGINIDMGPMFRQKGVASLL